MPHPFPSRRSSYLFPFCLSVICACISLTREIAMKALNLAFAAALVGASVSSAPAMASDNTWACEVVLCLSNPGGPTQYGACVPPITKLWRQLAFGGGFPTCSGSGIAKTKYKQDRQSVVSGKSVSVRLDL